MNKEKWEQVDNPSLISEKYGYYIDIKIEGKPHQVEHEVACIYGLNANETKRRALIVEKAPLMLDTLKDIKQIFESPDLIDAKAVRNRVNKVLKPFLK